MVLSKLMWFPEHVTGQLYNRVFCCLDHELPIHLAERVRSMASAINEEIQDPTILCSTEGR